VSLPPVISHPIPGREDCAECHAPDGPVPNPPDHEDYTLETCQVCHATEEEASSVPNPITHKLEGREECSLCHELDLLPDSHQEAEFSDRDCLLCHIPE